MSKLFSKPKALLGIVLVLCMVATMLPAGIFTSLAGTSNSDSLSVWDGDTIEPFQNYYERDEDGELILDEEQKPIPRPGTDFTYNKEPIEIANANQLAFLLFALEGTRGTRDTATNLIPVTFTFKGDTYNYPLPATAIGLFGSMTVKLTTDIDMNNIEIKTTNTIGGYMSGTFDGQGHTVYNINRVSTTTGAGFFRQVGYGGVKNLTVTGTVSGTQRVGGIAGNGVSAPTFDNCAFIGTITASQGTVGGIVGRHTTYDNAPTMRLKNCYTAGSLINNNSSNDVGGLVGYGAYTAVSSANKVPCGNVEITNCYSAMNITCNTTHCGGLAARTAQMGIIDYTDEDGNPASVDMGLFINNCHYSGTINKTSPIASATETVTNTFYKKGSHTGTASGAIGATEYEASEIDAIVAALNSGVDALEAAGTTGLNRWMAGADYPIFVQEEPVLDTLTVGGALIDLQKWPTYFSQTTESDSITVAATLPEDAPNSTKLAISAVDGEGNAVEISNGAVALKEGQTTVISVKTTYKELTKTYTVNIYKKPVVWDGTTVATAFAGGSGTSADPWLIANAAQLYYLSQSTTNNSGKYFKLIADIDLGGKQWTPIGASANFSGSFDGGNHTVYNMYMDLLSSDTREYAGFFGNVSGTVKNVHLVGAVINDVYNSVNQLGGMAGQMNGGTMENCSFDGKITCSHANYVGGLVGRFLGSPTVRDCWTTGSVTASGYKPGAIAASQFTPSATSTTTITIESCWSSMSLWGAADNSFGIMGGLGGKGNNTLNITDCYYIGSNANSVYPITSAVTGANNDGTNTVNVTNTYYLQGCHKGTAAGTTGVVKTAADFASAEANGVTALLNAGEAAWTLWNGKPVRYVGPEYALTNVEGFVANVTEYAATSKGTYSFDVADATEDTHVLVSADKAEALTSAGNRYTVTTEAGETVVVTIAGYKNGHKVIYTLTVADARWDGVATEKLGGTGTEADPYTIANAEQLAYLSKNASTYAQKTDAIYKLTADIDLNNKTWTPISTFVGTLDGQGYTIKNLYYHYEGTENQYKSANFALIKAIKGGYTTTIKNVNLQANIDTTEGSVAGFVVSTGNDNTNLVFDSCTFSGEIYATGTTYGFASTAPFVGSAGSKNGLITFNNCRVLDGTRVELTGSNVSYTHGAAGFVGYNSGSNLVFTNCYAGADIVAFGTGTGFGGYVGAPNHTDTERYITIENCVVAGSVTGSTIGGFVGFVRNDSAYTKEFTLTITDSYSTTVLKNASGAVSGGGFFGGTYRTDQSKHTDMLVVNIEDCYFAGQALQPIIYSYKQPKSMTVNNVYYLKGSASSNQITSDKNVEGSVSVSNVAEMTAAQFADGTVADLLGDGWATSSKGYPIHSTFVTPDNALDRLGTSIRTYTPGGMRFYFKMANAAQIAGLKEYGVVMAKAENATDGLFVGGYKTAKAKAFDGETTSHVREDETHDYFSAVITFKTDKNHETAYYARAYALYTDDKGQELIVYSDTTTTVHDDDYNNGEPVPCTLVNVAEIALADKEVQFSNSEVAYLEAIAKKKISSFE